MTTHDQICSVDLSDQGPPSGGSVPSHPPQPWPAGGALIKEAETGALPPSAVEMAESESLDVEAILDGLPDRSGSLGLAAQDSAVRAMIGHIPGIAGQVTSDFAAALSGKFKYFLWAGANPKDPIGRYWILLGLFRSSDLPTVIAAVAAKNSTSEAEAAESVVRFHTGLGAANVATMIGACVEIDHLGREEQERRYAALTAVTGLRWKLLGFSGGKSVQGYLSFTRMLDPQNPLWLRIQKLLVVTLEGDTRIVNPNRLMRHLGAVGRADGRKREQPLTHLDPTAHYAPEEIEAKLTAYAASMGILDVDAAYRALQVAEFLEVAARKTVANTRLLSLANKLRETRASAGPTDINRARRLLAELKAILQPTLAQASVSPAARRPSSKEGAVVHFPASVLAGFERLKKGTRVAAPCCGDGGDGSSGPAGTVLHDHNLGERPRIYCHRCSQTITVEAVTPTFGFTFEGSGGTTPLKEIDEGSATWMMGDPCAPQTSRAEAGPSATLTLDDADLAEDLHAREPQGGTPPPKEIELGSATGTTNDPCATVDDAQEPGVPSEKAAQDTSVKGAGGTTPSKEIELGSATRLVRVNAKRLTDSIPDALSLLPPEGGILMIRSPQETGKTYLATQIAAECLRRFPDDGQVAPTHRVALVRDLAGRLGYATYDVDASAQRVASTMDSLWRVPTFKLPDEVGTPTDRKFSLVVLDEGSQVLRHLVGGTVGADAPRVISHLQVMLANTRYVLVMDADLDDGTVEKIAMLAPGKAVVCVDNEWRPTDRTARIYSDRNDHLAALVADVGAGNRVAYLTAGGPKRAAAVAEMAQQAHPGASIRIYSQDTSRLPEVQDELADINTAISKYAVIIATPTLGSGVDIQDTGIERVYLDIPSHEVGADEAVQLGFRVRQPKDREWRIWVDPRKQNREVDPDRIREEILSVTRQTSGAVAKKYADAPCVRSVTATTMSPVDDLHLDLYCWARAHVHRQTNDLAAALRARLTEAGFKITEQGVVDPAVVQQAKQNFTAAREVTEDQRATRISAATQVNEEEAERIRRARRATQEEQDSGMKAEIGSFYGAPVTPELVREDDRGNLRGKVHLLAVHLLARQGEGHAALQPDVKRLRQGLTARVRGQYIAALILPHLLALYGVPTGTAIETFVGTLAPVPTFQQDVKRLVQVIRRFLRVSHRPLTVTRNGKTIWLAGVDPVHLLSRVLAAFGLGLTCTKAKVAGKTTRSYAIDTALAAHRVALAQASCQRLRDNLAELNRLSTADSQVEAIMLTDEDILRSLGHLVPDGGGTTLDDLLRGGSATFDVEAAAEPAAEATPLAVAPAPAAPAPRPWAVNDEDERRDDRRSRWWGADGPSAWA